MHTSGAESRLNLAPQHRTQLKAYYAVEHAAGLLGVHQVYVDVARMLYGVAYGRRRNLMEGYAARLLRCQPEHLIQMPCYGLSLAVFITRQPYHIGFLGFALQLAHQMLLFSRYLIFDVEITAQVLVEVPFGKIAYMTHARQHFVVFAKCLLKGFYLAR